MLDIGRVVDRYTVESELGAGGMAQVFRVRHNTLGTLHALKVLKVQSAQIRQRLVQEGKLQASIRHTNIVAVTDVIDVDGTPGLLMEYIEGPSLDVWLDKLAEQGQAPTMQEAERIFRGIVAGVARAHRHGLVHRDLKPGNVLLEDVDGVLQPKVADFGLAKILLDESSVSATRSGVAMGTPAYMSPEQIRDAKSVDQRTDIFALGCIFYELMVGKSPFDGPDVLSIFSALADGRYTPVEHIIPEMPAHLANTIRASLATNRDMRPSDCAAILSMLDGLEPVAGDAVNQRSVEPRASVGGTTGSNRTVAVSAIGAPVVRRPATMDSSHPSRTTARSAPPPGVSAPNHRSLRPPSQSGGSRGGETYAAEVSGVSERLSPPRPPQARSVAPASMDPARGQSLDPRGRASRSSIHRSAEHAPSNTGTRLLLVGAVGVLGGVGLLLAVVIVWAATRGEAVPAAAVIPASRPPSALIVTEPEPVSPSYRELRPVE